VSDEVDRAGALTFATALLSDLPPEQVDPALTDGPTEAERLLATVVARGVLEGGARALVRAGVLDRARTPVDLTLRELYALAAVCSRSSRGSVWRPCAGRRSGTCSSARPCRRASRRTSRSS
jgi:hypothetical protein